MKKPALTCKATVSPGIYADWLCSEQGWERQKDGGAIQRLPSSAPIVGAQAMASMAETER